MKNAHIAKAPMYAFKNKDTIKNSQIVGCYHCLAVFSPTEVQQYTDQGETALCPKCGTDTVITENNIEILKKINSFFFKQKH